MSPPQSNEPAPLILDNDPPALPSDQDEAEVGLVCETASGKLPTQRRDIASGEPADTDDLIRFVVSPDGVPVPDLAQKLPGRGIWLRCDRSSLELAVRKNIFSKAAKRQVRVDPGLVAQVHGLLRRRCLDLLGLARREGVLVTGFEKVLTTVKSGKGSWLIEASDGAEDGRRRILAAAKAVGADTNVCGCFSSAELSLALGLENAIHAALLPGRRVERWSAEMKRLSGFEALVLSAWQPPPVPPG